MELIEPFFTPDTPRCEHLIARPLQPSLLIGWDGVWRCRACTREFSHAMTDAIAAGTYRGLGQVEEHTCDVCRRYVPDEIFTPFSIRQDLWIVHLALCARCVESACAQGAQLITT